MVGGSGVAVGDKNVGMLVDGAGVAVGTGCVAGGGTDVGELIAGSAVDVLVAGHSVAVSVGFTDVEVAVRPWSIGLVELTAGVMVAEAAG